MIPLLLEERSRLRFSGDYISLFGMLGIN